MHHGTIPIVQAAASMVQHSQLAPAPAVSAVQRPLPNAQPAASMSTDGHTPSIQLRPAPMGSVIQCPLLNTQSAASTSTERCTASMDLLRTASGNQRQVDAKPANEQGTWDLDQPDLAQNQDGMVPDGTIPTQTPWVPTMFGPYVPGLSECLRTVASKYGVCSWFSYRGKLQNQGVPAKGSDFARL